MQLKPILFFLVVGGLASYVVVHQVRQGDGGVIRIGQIAPEFSVSDASEKQINLNDFRGQMVFLNFWASWCEPCEREMPDLERLNNKLKDKKFKMLTVSVDVDPGAAAKFYEQHHLTMPWYSDPGRVIADKYKVNVYPETFLIDANGHIIRHFWAINPQIANDVENYVLEHEKADVSSR